MAAVRRVCVAMISTAAAVPQPGTDGTALNPAMDQTMLDPGAAAKPWFWRRHSHSPHSHMPHSHTPHSHTPHAHTPTVPSQGYPINLDGGDHPVRVPRARHHHHSGEIFWSFNESQPGGNNLQFVDRDGTAWVRIPLHMQLRSAFAFRYPGLNMAQEGVSDMQFLHNPFSILTDLAHVA
eukprot:5876794-Prymnesium_polylepis.2